MLRFTKCYLHQRLSKSDINSFISYHTFGCKFYSSWPYIRNYLCGYWGVICIYDIFNNGISNTCSCSLLLLYLLMFQLKTLYNQLYRSQFVQACVLSVVTPTLVPIFIQKYQVNFHFLLKQYHNHPWHYYWL